MSESSRTPSLAEVIRSAIDHRLFDIHTSLPGRVDTFDPETQTANVKPLIKRRIANPDGTEFEESLPVIPRVPVNFPRAGKFYITWPLKKGDLVELVFTETSRDNFKAGDGEEADPDDFRRFDLSDAYAVPGAYPESKAIKDFDSDNLALGVDDGGAVIRIKENGDISIIPSGSGKVHVGAESAALAIARLTDKTIAGTAMALWVGAVTTAIGAIAGILQAPPPGTPVVTVAPPAIIPPIPPTDFGVISTAASKAKAT